MHFTLNLSTSYEFLRVILYLQRYYLIIILLITLQTPNYKDIRHPADGYKLGKGKAYNLSVNLR